MKMTRRTLGLVALLAGVAAPAAAQMTPITSLNCTASNFPNCGWGNWGLNAHHTLTRVGNGARFTLVPGSASQITQFYMGWGVAVPQANQGDSRYIRLRLRVNGPVRPSGVGDLWTDKFIILGDGSDNSSRVIIELRPNMTDNGLETRIQKNIAGDEARTPLLGIPNDQTVSLQFEARSGSSGRVAVWMNNDTYGSPTRVSPNFSLSAAAWNNIRVGFYSNASLASSGNINFEVTDVQYDDQFDANWSGGGGGGGGGGATPPGQVTGVRVISASAVGLVPIVLVSMLAMRRRRGGRVA
jgi:hypothetical protein